MMGIYMVLNEHNGNCYVGQSIDIKQRWYQHKSDSRNKNSYSHKYPLYRAIRKYGLDWLSFHILEEVKEKNNVTSREEFWYNLIKPEYCILKPQEHPGGREKQAVYKIQPETLNVLEELESMAEAGRVTGVHRFNIQKACIGKYSTAGGFHWCKVKDWEKAWRPKPDNNKVAIICMNKNTGEEIKRFTSVVEAGEWLGKPAHNISSVLSGKLKTAYGYKWRKD